MLDNTVYVRTYFRIQTPSYFNGGNLGFKTEEDRRAFYSEAVAILKGAGFSSIRNEEMERRGHAATVNRGVESLYCHPQELSGYIAEDAIPDIEEALSHAKTFKHYNTDRYETALNYTVDEFQQSLEEKRADIVSKILERFKTKRRNLYLPGYALNGVRTDLPIMKSGVRVNGIDGNLDAIQARYISGIFDELVTSGDILIAQKDGTKYYRARSHRDPKKDTPVQNVSA